MTKPGQQTWHSGELAAQARAGARERMATLGPRLIREYMPDQHRNFFATLQMVVVGSIDTGGHLWANAIPGKPGFIQSPSPRLLTIHLSECSAGNDFRSLPQGSRVGLLGIDFENSRRNRLNGEIVDRTQDQVTIRVQQSFGNCPQYIRQRRTGRQLAQQRPVTREWFSSWSNHLRELICSADTGFIASAYVGQGEENYAGLDVSHRGGAPGFIRFDDEQRLLIPDYPGNSFFNTIGNLTIDSRAGLMLPDFDGGHVISMTMRAQVIWKIDDPFVCGEHDRIIQLTLQKGCIIRNILPRGWQPIDPA